nr:hypothetical protein [Tanacetum cinerariifolium]
TNLDKPHSELSTFDRDMVINMVSIQELNIGGSGKMMRKKPSNHKYENQRCSYDDQAMLAA